MVIINYQGVLYAVVEIVIMIFIGQLFKQRQVISEKTNEELNNLVFNILFPINIMMGFYKIDLETYLTMDFLLYNLIVMAFHIVMVLGLVKVLIKDKENRVLVANGSYRGNFIIMSTPILTAIYGDKALPLIGLLVGISQFVYNFYSVFLFESINNRKINILEQVISIIKNPMIIGFLLGILLYISKINLYFLEGPLRNLSSLASPLALIVLGYSLNLNIDFKNMKDYLLTSILKLILLPVTALIIARFFNLSEIQKVVSVVLYGAPTAVNTFVFAKKYNIKEELAGDLVLITTILYSFTIFLILRLV